MAAPSKPWREGAAIILVGVASHAVNGMRPVIISTYAHVLGFDLGQAGYLLTAELLATNLGTIVATLWLDKLSGRRPMSVAMSLLLVANLLSGVSVSHPLMLLLPLRLVCGVSAGFGMGRLAIMIGLSRTPERLSGVYSVGTSVFAAIAAFCAPGAITVLGPSGLFLLVAALVPLALAATPWLPVTSLLGAPPTGRGGRRTLAILPVGLAAYYLSLGLYWPFVSSVGAVAGVGYRDSANVLGWSGIVSAAASLLAIVAGDRQSSTRCLLVLLGTGCLAEALPLIAPSLREAFWVSTCLFAFSWYALFPFLLGLMARIDPSGRLNGILYVIASAGFAAGPALGGCLVLHLRPFGLIWLQSLSLGSLALASIILARAALLHAPSVKAGGALAGLGGRTGL